MRLFFALDNWSLANNSYYYLCIFQFGVYYLQAKIVSARQILESLEQTGKINSDMSKYTTDNNILMQHLAYKL